MANHMANEKSGLVGFSFAEKFTVGLIHFQDLGHDTSFHDI